jgi:putative Mg2+ transporter-C (MgtC) family protein
LNYLLSWITNNLSYFEMFLRLFLAALVGGIIGYERQSSHRPAGLRTHILVCVGAALAMVTSKYIFEVYGGITKVDPARLGAQVISGIGFLGAGTILRDGSTVKGLTTAAGIWVVSCIGIAIGAGFYFGGISAAILVYITLQLSKDWEASIKSNTNSRKIRILAENHPRMLGLIESKFAESNTIIKSINIVQSSNKECLKLLCYVDYPGSTAREKVIDSLNSMEGIIKVS